MRNFIITVNGKNYEVGVEEVGAGAQAPAVVSAPKEAPKAAAAAAAAPKAAPAVGEKVVSPFPGSYQESVSGGRRRREKRSARPRFGGDENG